VNPLPVARKPFFICRAPMLLKKAAYARPAMTGTGQTKAVVALQRMIRFVPMVRERRAQCAEVIQFRTP
jgi:hypothetical protein